MKAEINYWLQGQIEVLRREATEIAGLLRTHRRPDVAEEEIIGIVYACNRVTKILDEGVDQ